MIAAHYSPGKKFGRMTIIQRVDKVLVQCRCDCGTEKVVRALSLKYGHISSCGCLRKELLATKNRTHGYTRTRTYAIWSGMITRCSNPARREYKWYGERGIKVCERWTTFQNFLDDMGEAPAGFSIDRINPDGPYTKNNCRWATTTEQAVNKRRTVYMTLLGETKPMATWAKDLGIPYGTLKSRKRLGWPDERALTTAKLA